MTEPVGLTITKWLVLFIFTLSGWFYYL